MTIEERAKSLQDMLVRNDEDIGSITTLVNIECALRDLVESIEGDHVKLGGLN